MTTGEKLKKQFNLDSIQQVYISFIYGSSPAVYLILWDSMRPNMPITKQYLQRYSNVVFYKQGKELGISPPMNIERTNFNTNTGIFVTYDIAMSGRTTRESKDNSSRMSKNKLSIDIDTLSHLKIESSLEKLFVGNLNKIKELTLKDLKDSGQSGISDRTYLWFQDRNKNGFQASKAIKLIDSSISEGDNSFTFYFLAESTEGEIKVKDLKDSPYDYNEPKGEVEPSNFDIKNNPSKTYEIQIKFTDLKEFIDYLNTKPEGTKVTKKDIDYLIGNMDVQYFSNSPSYHWQGYNNISSELGLSIYPTSITSKQWMPKTFNGEYYLDKHLFSFVQSYQFYSQQMAMMIGKKLKDRNLI